MCTLFTVWSLFTVITHELLSYPSTQYILMNQKHLKYFDTEIFFPSDFSTRQFLVYLLSFLICLLLIYML